MVNACATHRDSLRETLHLLHAPQRRSTAPATASAETGKQGGARKRNSSCGTVREVRPNTSLNHRTPNGGLSWPCLGYAVHFPSPGQASPPLGSG
jgi:hypothetical protein